MDRGLMISLIFVLVVSLFVGDFIRNVRGLPDEYLVVEGQQFVQAGIDDHGKFWIVTKPREADYVYSIYYFHHPNGVVTIVEEPRGAH